MGEEEEEEEEEEKEKEVWCEGATDGLVEIQTIPHPTAPELPEVYAELVFQEVQLIEQGMRAMEEEEEEDEGRQGRASRMEQSFIGLA